jgi:hypothetical protein
VIVFLQNYTDLEEVVPGLCCEMHPTSDAANQTMNIKAEEVSDVEENTEPVTFRKIKAEPEVSCMSVCVSLLRRYHTYAEMSIVFLISIFLSVHMNKLHVVDWILKVVF